MTDAHVGFFHTGRVQDGFPVSLPGWRVTTTQQEVATAVAQLMGGDSSRSRECGQDRFEVMTASAKVPVLLAGPSALQSEMRLWGPAGLAHHCDGTVFLGPQESIGAPCGCPALMHERKAAAKAFKGPQPFIRLSFLLAENRQLGTFQLRSTSWRLAESIPVLADSLVRAGGSILAELYLETVPFRLRSGAVVTYRKPAISISAVLNAAVYH